MSICSDHNSSLSKKIWFIPLLHMSNYVRYHFFHLDMFNYWHLSMKLTLKFYPCINILLMKYFDDTLDIINWVHRNIFLIYYNLDRNTNRSIPYNYSISRIVYRMSHKCTHNSTKTNISCWTIHIYHTHLWNGVASELQGVQL